jgi:hypothetical protein
MSSFIFERYLRRAQATDCGPFPSEAERRTYTLAPVLAAVADNPVALPPQPQFRRLIKVCRNYFAFSLNFFIFGTSYFQRFR